MTATAETRTGATAQQPPAPKGLADLTQWIVATHHTYTREAFAGMAVLFESARTEGRAPQADLSRLHQLVGALRADLEPHMMKEERILFPFIAQLDRAASTGGPAPFAPFGTVDNPIRMMLVEHGATEAIQRNVRGAVDALAGPAENAPALRALCEAVRALDDDINRHMTVEEDELFTRARALEGALGRR